MAPICHLPEVHSTYFELYRMRTDRHWLHQKLVTFARQHGLSQPRKKKPRTKKQLRSVKRQWKLFGQLSTDTKYLQDIPHYWTQMVRLNLPRFQYTAREPVSGACFTGYADELSKSYAVFLAEQLSVHLAGHGVDLSSLTWQTDNGSEFLESQEQPGLPSTVRTLGSNHRYIPPKRYTWQSDVETVHRLVEDEFFDRETFSGHPDFWNKITTYWLFFNMVRPNRGKEWQSPFQILKATAPAIAGAVLEWIPLNLAKLIENPALVLPTCALVMAINPSQILPLTCQTHGAFSGIHGYEATNGSDYRLNSSPSILFT